MKKTKGIDLLLSVNNTKPKKEAVKKPVPAAITKGRKEAAAGGEVCIYLHQGQYPIKIDEHTTIFI